METFAQNVVSASIMNLAEEVMVPVLMDARLDIYLIYAKVSVIMETMDRTARIDVDIAETTIPATK